MIPPSPKVLWPRSYPIYTLLGFLLSCLLCAGLLLWRLHQFQPLEKFYLGSYIRASLLPFKQPFRLIRVATPSGFAYATDPWIEVLGSGKTRVVRISKDGIRHGIGAPSYVALKRVDPNVMQSYLRSSIYHDPLLPRFYTSFAIGGAFLLVGLFWGARKDRAYDDRVRNGVQVRGPRLLSPAEAQKALAGDGISLYIAKD